MRRDYSKSKINSTESLMILRRLEAVIRSVARHKIERSRVTSVLYPASLTIIFLSTRELPHDAAGSHRVQCSRRIFQQVHKEPIVPTGNCNGLLPELPESENNDGLHRHCRNRPRAGHLVELRIRRAGTEG